MAARCRNCAKKAVIKRGVSKPQSPPVFPYRGVVSAAYQLRTIYLHFGTIQTCYNSPRSPIGKNDNRLQAEVLRVSLDYRSLAFTGGLV